MNRRDFLKRSLATAGSAGLLGFEQRPATAEAQQNVRVETIAIPDSSGGLYWPNRAPMNPSAFMKLPSGSIAPKGWLLEQMTAQANGLNGRMTEVSDYLDITKSGWAVPANDGFEEVGYWYRGFAPLGYGLNDPRIMETTKQWAIAIMATQQVDGWFGPTRLKTSMNGGPDLWPHIPILYGIRSYQENTGDPQVIPFMTKYFQYQSTVPPPTFGNGWGATRMGDNLDSIYWLYNRTGNAFLLDLIKVVHANSAPWTTDMPTYHNVNLSQGFKEPALYSLLDGDPKYLAATERIYKTIYDNFGQFAGGGFAGDEGCRPGCMDPRQAFETCGIAEIMLSHEAMTRVTGNPKWADYTERVAFNSLPAALDPKQLGCRYLTSANSAVTSAIGAQHRQVDDSPQAMQIYQLGIHDYRCCPHNYGMAWPLFAENLWLATTDNGLCASMYAPCELTAKAGSGTNVKIITDTEYPFKDTATITVNPEKSDAFPIYLRIPVWCGNPTVKINGVPIDVAARPQSYFYINRTWSAGDTIFVHLTMQTLVKTWTLNKNAVSVAHGPLEYSLAIEEKWVRSGGTDEWPSQVISPASPWNYGLELSSAVPADSFSVAQKGGPFVGNPFTYENNPIELKVKGRKIPQWQLESDGFTPTLQQSPVGTTEPAETLTLVPMGTARIRISTFPTVTATGGSSWHNSPAYIASVNSSQDNDWPWTSQCLLYGAEPASSLDLRTPRLVLKRRATSEWVQYKLPNVTSISSVRVYWFDDSGSSGGWYPDSGYYRAPKSWHLEYRDAASWKPVTTNDIYGTALNQYNTVHFDPVSTSAIRLVTNPADGHTAIYRFDIVHEDEILVPTLTEAATKSLNIKSGISSNDSVDLPVAWFAADSTRSDGSGDSLTTWLDGSSSVNDASSSGQTPPTIVSNAINGLPVVHFDATKSQYYVFDRPIQDDFTIAVVFRSIQGVSDGTQYFQCAGLVQGEVGGVTDDFGIALNDKGQVVAGTGNPDTSVASAPGFDDGKPHIAIFTRTRDTGAFSLSVDGQSPLTATASTRSLTAPATLGIGAQNNGANCYTGDIAEIIILPVPLLPPDANALQRKLATKWGMTSL